MDLSVVNHKDYFAKIGDDHKFPINKFGELANYLIKKKIVKKFYIPYACSEETLKRAHALIQAVELHHQEIPTADYWGSRSYSPQQSLGVCELLSEVQD